MRGSGRKQSFSPAASQKRNLFPDGAREYFGGVKRFSFLIGAALLPLTAAAADELFLTGLVDYGQLQRAFVRRLPGDDLLTLRPGREVGGLELLSLDILAARALVRDGTNLLTLNFPGGQAQSSVLEKFAQSGRLPPDYAAAWPAGYEPEIIRRHRAGTLDPSAGPLTDTPGAVATADYISAIRRYARTLPPEEREPFLRELEQYKATPVAAADGTARSPESFPGPTVTPTVSTSDGSTPTLGSPAIPGDLLAQLNTPAPDVGTLQGTAPEISAWRRLRRAQSDPALIARIEAQLLGYASPPIGD